MHFESEKLREGGAEIFIVEIVRQKAESIFFITIFVCCIQDMAS